MIKIRPRSVNQEPIEFKGAEFELPGRLSSLKLVCEIEHIHQGLPKLMTEFFMSCYPKHGGLAVVKEDYYGQHGVLQAIGTACESSKLAQLQLLFEGQLSDFRLAGPLNKDHGAPVKDHGYLTMKSSDGVEWVYDPTYKALLRGMFYAYRSDPRFEDAMAKIPDYFLGKKQDLFDDSKQFLDTISQEIGAGDKPFINPPILSWKNFSMIYLDTPQEWNGSAYATSHLAAFFTDLWSRATTINPWKPYAGITTESIEDNKDPDRSLIRFAQQRGIIEVLSLAV